MAKYKIKVIQHCLKNNKIAVSGDIVDGSQLPDLDSSIKGGYVELVKGSKKADAKKADAKKAEAKEIDPAVPKESLGNG